MRLITFTNLYPSRDMPRHGIFVEERLRHLVGSGDVEADVIALRPALPRTRRSKNGSRKTVTEVRAGIHVGYFSVPTLPRLSNWIDPWTWAAAAEPALRDVLQRRSEPAVLDAHFLYPDGVAATILSQRVGLPVVISARGSDVNVKCQNLVMRKWVRWAAVRSSAIIAVSRALASRIAELDIVPPILEVIPNGVDLEKFRRRNREYSRSRFGVSGHVIASVGHLVDEKGHHFAVEALLDLPESSLLIAGEGPRKGDLQKLAGKLGVGTRVHFAGLVPHEDMPYLYSAADVLVLPSLREGMPNVILESLACGTRVVASDTGGIKEIVRSDTAGALMSERSTRGLLDGLRRMLATPVDAQVTRKYSEQFGWEHIVGHQIALYQTVLGNFTG